MKNLLLSIILTSACILGYGQVKGPERVKKLVVQQLLADPLMQHQLHEDKNLKVN